MICPDCEGCGEQPNGWICETCNGAGYVEEDAEVDE